MSRRDDKTPDLFGEPAPPETRADAVERVAVESLNAMLRNPDRDSIPRTTPDPKEIPEVILNLWYIYDDTGICYALRAKAYVANGTDQEKLDLLHRLAPSDWRIASFYPVPAQYVVVGPDGEQQMNAFHLAQSEAIGGLITLFEPAIRKTEAEFPGDCKLRIPQDPLLCLTPLYLHDDHTMEALIATPEAISRNRKRMGLTPPGSF